MRLNVQVRCIWLFLVDYLTKCPSENSNKCLCVFTGHLLTSHIPTFSGIFCHRRSVIMEESQLNAILIRYLENYFSFVHICGESAQI